MAKKSRAKGEVAAAVEPTAIDYSLTHRVTRISKGAPDPFRLFFNALGRSLEFAPADADENPGTPQDVCAAVAEAITGDEGLAPHFKVEPISPAEAPASGPAERSAAEEGQAAPPSGRSVRRRSEPAT